MDQQAKRHLQEEFDACVEEKDQYISVLQTQVRPGQSPEAVRAEQRWAGSRGLSRVKGKALLLPFFCFNSVFCLL